MFGAFLDGCWSQHGDDPEAVAARFGEGLELAAEPVHLSQLANLVVHVAGEHLGRWDDGLAWLDRIAAAPLREADSNPGRATIRCRAVLEACTGRLDRAEAALAQAIDPARPPGSSRGRMWAVAASALAGQQRIAEAQRALDAAEAAVDYGPDAEDPVGRSLAITGNNLACALEELDGRDAAQTALMKRAAALGRTWWEVAGTWHNVMLAEVRLAFTHLAADEPSTALAHARAALALSTEHGTGADDLIAPHCLIAKAMAASGDPEAPAAIAQARETLEQASEQLQAWYRPVMEGLGQ